MIKYQITGITDISLVIDTISIYRKNDISKVPIQYQYSYINIGDILTIYSIYWPISSNHLYGSNSE